MNDRLLSIIQHLESLTAILLGVLTIALRIIVSKKLTDKIRQLEAENKRLRDQGADRAER